VVNAVNVLQSAGFLSRVYTGNREINQLLGLVYLAFVGFEVVVDYVWRVEFRVPRRCGILVPYLLLFFGAILLMGLPMFRLNRRLWLVTVATTVLLLASMGVAMYAGVG
jgi:hypothetical protein